MKKITLKELSKILNMSVSTVSRALSDHPDISESTKIKVREASELYHYTPNLRARYLRTKSSGLVALILPEYNMFFIPTLMKAISEVVNENNYSLLVFQSDDSYEKELDIIEYCNQISVDGILLSIGTGFDHRKDLIGLTSDGIPIVLLDRVWPNEKLSHVSIEGEQISERAVSYLKSKGHKFILGIFGSLSYTITQTRMKGFEMALEKEAGEIKGESVVAANVADLDEQLEEALARHPETTAMYMMSDELSLKTYHFLNSRGYKIPEQISVIAISDGTLPYLIHPNLTHFFHSPAEIGSRAARILFDLIKTKEPKIFDVRIECNLVELSSVAELK